MQIDNDPWEHLGTLEEDEPLQVLITLYSRYSEDVRAGKKEKGADLFFQRLYQAIVQSKECNLNRR